MKYFYFHNYPDEKFCLEAAAQIEATPEKSGSSIGIPRSS
jgi:hypothetical protein